MQKRDQWRPPRNWKIVAGAATVGALGLTGLAFAGPLEDTTEPPAVDLQERTVGETNTSTSLPFRVVFPERVDLDSSFDSPFDDDGDTASLASPSPAGADGSELSPDSPDDAVDSPDDSPDDAVDSPDNSPDTTDSPDASFDSPDDSAAS